MANWKRVKIDEDVHTLAKAAAAARRKTLQDVTTKALRYWYVLLDAARTAAVTGETEELAEIVKAIDDA